tara:strand:+ start:291 stop:947 length:657 start_codon:yes stop_codon:yes gene_type:complete
LIAAASVITFSSLAGIFFAPEKAYAAGYIFLLLLLLPVILYFLNYRNYRLLWWIPLMLAVGYMYNFIQFGLRCSEPFVGRAIQFFCCLTPLISVVYFPFIKHNWWVMLIKFVLAIPTVLLAFGVIRVVISPIERIEKVYLRSGNTYKLVYSPKGCLDDIESLHLWKTEQVFPGYEKRTKVDGAVANYGKVKFQFKGTDSIYVEYSDYGLKQIKEFHVP